MRLGELAVINTGIVAARRQASPLDKVCIRYRILNLKAINEKGYIEDNLLEEFVANGSIKEKYLTQEGDLVVRLTTPFTAVLIDRIHKGIVVPSHFIVIRVKSGKILPEYLYWLLNTEKVRQDIWQNINSTTMGTVKPMSYASLYVECITLAEQEKIGELYKLAQRELRLLERLKEQKELYYREAIDRIQKEMRQRNEDNKK
ncbi:MAG: restriction endonuclease subunit S [Hungatella sp.]|nr:restriction endonuclease subunit S [Hungatella sp.]